MKTPRFPEKKEGEPTIPHSQDNNIFLKKKLLHTKISQAVPVLEIETSKILLWLFIICIFTIVAYSPSFKNEVTNWDDNKYITENPYFKNLDKDNVKKIFSEYYMGNYHPITMLTLTTDYLVAGRNTKGDINVWMFHMVNIMLHLISTLLVFWFVFLLFRKFKPAIVAAIIFGLHTMHVESVTWMSERKDVLYAAFFIASLVSYVYYIRQFRMKYLIISLSFFVLSLMSKGQAVSLAVTLIAIDYYSDRKLLSKKVILEKIPFFILAIIFGFIAIRAQKAGEVIYGITDYDFYKRIGFAGYGFSQYLIKLVWPTNLSAIYPYPDMVNRGIPFYYWLFMIPVLSTVFLLKYTFNKSKEIFFGISFFVINIFLLLQLIPVGGALYADRYAYIPSIGFCILLGIGYQHLTEKRTNLRQPINLIFIIYILALGTLTFQRSQIWRNSYTLWNDALKKEPDASIAWNNLGSIKGLDKDYDGAIKDFTRAISVDPYYDRAFYNRGTSKKDLGMERNDKVIMESAILDFNIAIEINSDFQEAYTNRGFTKDLMGDQAGAIPDLDKAIKLNPKDPIAYINRGIAKGKTGRYKEAIDDFSYVIQLSPNNYSAFSNRGIAHDQTGDTKKAIEDFNKAIGLNPKFTDAFINRGVAKHKMKDLRGAIDDFSQAISINPQIPDIYYNRGICLLENGDKDSACNDFRTAGITGHQDAQRMYQQYCLKK